MRMTFYWILEHLNKIKYLTFRFFACRVDLSFCYLLFEGGKKAFCNGVIMTISSTTHGRNQIVSLHKGEVIRTRVLAPLIAVH
jgi:hypothetical protein